MTAERWTHAVRRQLGLGRLLPLGGAQDGAWIAERAVEPVLRDAVTQGVPEVRLGTVRIALADSEEAAEPVVPSPPGALPPGPLRLSAEFAAVAPELESESLPATADRLRAALAQAAAEHIGLAVTEVDLTVTDLLEGPPEPPETGEGVAAVGGTGAGSGSEADGAAAGAGSGDDRTAGISGSEEDQAPSPADSDESRVAAAALAVPGVARLTRVLGRAVHFTETAATSTALPRRHVRVDLAVRADHRPVEVGRAVRTAVSQALPDQPTAAVLVTSLD
ncbi:nucleopolyhedrovirus P10 family protein [Streptomyces thermocarboxydovorans]|uniref:nucleopolyhedrovirus P10 family protein n=1 Tax=Streptomyces thermocarboxydovorans TaxID=59298 RepID=UPI0031E418BA